MYNDPVDSSGATNQVSSKSERMIRVLERVREEENLPPMDEEYKQLIRRVYDAKERALERARDQKP